MASAAQRDQVLAFYDGISGWLKPAVESLAEDADAVLATSRASFEEMLDELPYVDRPQHTMAASMFACAAMLAVFENLRARKVDARGLEDLAEHALACDRDVAVDDRR